MKKIFLTGAVAIGVLALTGCSDFLDQSSASELDTENTYNSEYYTGAFINKIYGGLTQDLLAGHGLHIQYEQRC